MATIHPTAIVHPKARLGKDVSIGPYSVVDCDVEVGDRTAIGAHTVITGHTTIGRENKIFHFCSIGEANQDKKYAGEPTRLEIGDRNTIREYCSLNRGTTQDTGVTRIGSDNWIMAYCHVAHDCVVGNHTTFANHATLAGHVHVGDWTVLGGFTGVHQFVKIGAHVMTGVSSVVLLDIPTYVMVGGNPLAPYGINAEGLKRRGFSPTALSALKQAYKTLYKSGLTFAEARAELEKQAAVAPEVRVLVDFLGTATRGIVR
ncbi:acyl-ACP--UDP-N-acetylglucosamine O-acyltransferase [Usitatibacter palustris]|uniref:Acyl-[acyl-carrier-protein]--UDP-N-acetylglucosamine O-acyltransferase n=1 Tax=Usitatibacter palustris TaxID=2732487 RepID=A0A6M4H5C6_9PROT|nr:acyl-ACP--UDP-N-acetylglucosamine O-acyltransferase [Usitatibacter palustris]QJR14158.1 Acyl-[acyl-carrier-protein]--UDP-N-acetylglucosamine O-acyltransferase [Usitatibacter palustris]